MVVFDEEKQEERLKTLRNREEEELAETLAAHHGVPYLDLSAQPINIDALRVIKEADAREAQIAVFNATDKRIDVGVLSPKNDGAIKAIEDLKQRGYLPEIFMVSHQSLEKVWGRYKDLSYSFETKSGALDISNDEILELTKKALVLEDIKKMIEDVLSMKKAYRISRILEIILAGGISLKASDIHIEPEEDNVRLRYRLDGILINVLFFDKETFELLNSRLKLISELKLNVRNKAQDGRFSIKLGSVEIEIRTSMLPGPNGESIVLRILNPNAISVELEKLGIHSKLLEILKKEIKKPNGMILTTGPTGSGKTTTLYAFLKKIYTSEIKVITIENPVEYHLEGIVQTQAEPESGYSFAEGLRSALRQDPDVIMVGEIRDEETAEVAVNAALTGHLVLSTLHTNNAAGSFPRLLDLGINPKVISSALNISIAQRLIRTLCHECKKEVPLEGKTKETIERIVASIDDQSYLEGIPRDKVWIPSNKETDGVICPICSGIGYKGRIGVYEAILIDSDIEKVVITNPSERDIREAAKKQKLLTLAQDGVLKILSGMTTLEELERVLDLSV
ncbi:MAG: type II/IV secretion system protein [Candidatus Zambryskibacteria bacterium]|nr:type II/IV secretion system protein [Candidatus Zambryskibacteria bacterium]